MWFQNCKNLKNNLVRAPLPKMDNPGGSVPPEKGTCQVYDHKLLLTFLQQKHAMKYLKFNVDPLTVTQKMSFTFWGAKFVMTLPMLEMIKHSSVLNLIIIKVNTNLFEKKNRMYHKSDFIHTIYKIATKVMIIGKSLYLRSMKRSNNLKKGNMWQNKLKSFHPFRLNEIEEYLFESHTVDKTFIIFFSSSDKISSSK